MSDDGRYVIEILDLALEVIDTMASNQEEYLSPAYLARQIKINRSRTFRILKTLERRGYVEYDPKTETYRLGMKFLSISKNIRERLSLRREAEEILKDLASTTGDSSYLVISTGKAAIVIDRYTGDNMLQLSAPIGTQIPFHVGAAPKLLLAYMPEEERQQVLEQIELTCFTPNTITDINQFLNTLADIRAHGYSVDEQDYEMGAYAFGAPVYDHDGCVIAGVSITTPSARYADERRAKLIHQVVEAARTLSKKLGYQDNP